MIIMRPRDWKFTILQEIRTEVLARAENSLICFHNLNAFQVKWLQDKDLVREQQLEIWQNFWEINQILKEDFYEND